MNAFSRVQRISTRPFFIFPFIRFFMVAALLVPVIFMSPPLQAQTQTKTDEDIGTVSAPVLLTAEVPDLLQSVLNAAPDVRRQAALVCQAGFRLGQSVARKRPQISASISGGKALIQNHPSRPTNDEDQAIARSFDDTLNQIYDLNLDLEYALWDWGRSKTEIHSRRVEKQSLMLELEVARDDALRRIVASSIQIRLHQQSADLSRSILDKIAPHIEAIEAQGVAGTIGLADVRQAKLRVLELELGLQETQARLQQSLAELDRQFGLQASDAAAIFEYFVAHRPLDLQAARTEQSQAALIHSLRGQSASLQAQAIAKEKRPVFVGRLETTFYDLRDYEDEYQMLGQLEMRMPLYDGGSNKARAAESRWRARESDASFDQVVRDRIEQENRNRLSYDDALAQRDLLADQLNNQQSRLESLLALLDTRQAARLEIVDQMIAANTLEVAVLTNQLELELARLISLFLSENLDGIMAQTLGVPTC